VRVTQEQSNDAGSAAAEDGGADSGNMPVERNASLIAAGIKALRAAALYGHWDLFKSLLETSTGSLHRVLAGEALAISSQMGDAKTLNSLPGTGSDSFEKADSALSLAVLDQSLKASIDVRDITAVKLTEDDAAFSPLAV
jgi:hypothetical protein